MIVFRFLSSFTRNGTSDRIDPHDKSVYFNAMTKYKGALVNKTAFLENLTSDMLVTIGLDAGWFFHLVLAHFLLCNCN